MSELLEASVVKTVAYALSERVIEVEIVHDRKAHGEHFFRLEQVPDIRAGIASAHRAYPETKRTSPQRKVSTRSWGRLSACSWRKPTTRVRFPRSASRWRTG